MTTEENGTNAASRAADVPMEWRMKGKTVLFTGASRGMGRFAAIELARRGAEILIAGHNEVRGAGAVEAIRGAGGPAEFLRADMGDAEEVRALAKSVLARHQKIDVLIHGAGGLQPSAARTREGVDRGFAQNFLGAYLLTRLLEERLLASAPARMIAIGSSAHRFVKKVDLDAFMHSAERQMSSSQKGNYQMLSYQVAKLAVTTWIYGLARRWLGRGVTANLLDPGLVKGQFGEQFEGPAPIRLMLNRIAPFFVAVATERGSAQYVRRRPTRPSRICPVCTSSRARKRKRAAPHCPRIPPCRSASTTRLRRGRRRSCPAFRERRASHGTYDRWGG